jgi:hypothetical protein
MIEKNRVSIQDNFLWKEQFEVLRNTITGPEFPWYFNPIKVSNNEDRSITPGQFVHMVYERNAPCSQYYDFHFIPILKQLNVAILTRIKLNLNPRLSEPFYATFHIDSVDAHEFHEDIRARMTTSILYINTNNGYTELENGEEDTRIENVANRLVTFPADIMHRGVTQTDEQTRIMINFNYILK